VATIHGLVVLDKPAGITSRDAVNRALRWFPGRTRIGHTGTLDPLATGVLVLCIGMATRLTEYVQRMGKTYRTVILLGARSDTDDADGFIQPVLEALVPDPSRVTQSVVEFVGDIEQLPPAFSAAKVAGRRAYDLARQGDDVRLSSRRVRVHGIDVLSYAYPRLELEVRCGKGTYIRSLARDLGERLGCGAYVQELRRTQVGPFGAADTVSLDADSATAHSRLLPVATAVAELHHLKLPPAEIASLQHGRTIDLPAQLLAQGQLDGVVEVAVFTENGCLAGIGTVELAQGRLRPSKIFPTQI
jgi:tRNA pseudouridine55 synthase